MIELRSRTMYDVEGHICFRCELEHEDGTVDAKTISTDAYLNMLKNGLIVKETTQKFRVGGLPEGYVDGAISSDGGFSIVIMVKGRNRILKHFENVYDIPYPNLLFLWEFDAKGKPSQKRKVFAITDDRVTPGTKLYKYPFGNVQTNGGNICIGNIVAVSGLTVTSMAETHKMLEQFFGSVTSDDYWTGERVAGKYSKQKDLLKYLDGKKKYPKKLLVEEGRDAKWLCDQL